MRIGDFARLGNVSPRTLRFYGQAGLLRPAHVKFESGYRHYDPRQLAQLHQIQVFKEMGLSLGEIRALLARRSTPAELREVLRERRSALLRRMQEDSGRLAWIDARIRALEGHRNAAPSEVQLRQTRPMWVVSLREKIHRYEEAEAMFEELERRLGPAQFPASVQPCGTPARTKGPQLTAKFCDSSSSWYRCEETCELSSCLL